MTLDIAGWIVIGAVTLTLLGLTIREDFLKSAGK